MLYSFSFPLPISYDIVFDEPPKHSRFLVWSTYIYSPSAQKVNAGVMYEHLWINGKACPTSEDKITQLRFNAIIPLDEGWNYLFVYTDASQDLYDGYLALPADRGLVISADKDPKSELLFRHTSISPIELDEELRAIPLPIPEDYNLTKYGGWKYTTSKDSAASPCREASWDSYLTPIESLTPETAGGFVVNKSLYPEGFTLVFDMDHMRLVFPVLKLGGGLRNAVIDIIYGDRYAPDGLHLVSKSWIPLGDRITCSGDPLDWMPIQPRGFKYIGITVRNTCGDVVLDDISFLSAHYPVSKTGCFECSDPLLNRIWEMGALTQYINMEDTYTDCVDRERGLYALDLLIQYHVNLVCFGDQPLMKRALELYGQSLHDIGLFRCLYPNTGDYILPDFCLYIIDSFYVYYRQTKDIETIKCYWLEIMSNIKVFNKLSDERADKLMCADKPGGDWPREPVDNRTGFLGDGPIGDITGINCMFSAMYLTTLKETLELAELVSEADVPDLKARIAILEKSIPEAFWNEEKGLFADTIEHKSFFPQSSLSAVIAGVVTEKQKERLQKTLPPTLLPFYLNGIGPEDGFRFETSRGFYIFEALYKLGMDKVVEQLIKEAWGHFLKCGFKTTPEHFCMQHSHCHAWTAHPTYMLSHHVLGLKYDAISDKVTLIPQPGTVKWAKGIIPIPGGTAEAQWHIENDELIIDSFEVKR